VRQRSGPDEIPRKSFLELMPRGSLPRIATLLLILVAIVALQQNSTSIVKRLTDTLNVISPPPPEARVRMAPTGQRP